MKILYITTDWNTPYRIATGECGGIGYYRAYAPAKALRAKGIDIDVKGYDLSHDIKKDDVFGSYRKVFKPYDLVVIKQADTANAGKLIGACKSLKIPIAMDLDDLIIELDPDNPAVEKGYEQGGTKQAMAIGALSMVDALFTSTQPLADEYKKFLKERYKMDMPVYVLPNCMDETLWSKINRTEADKNVVLGWQGSITHDADIKLILPVVIKLMKKYPNLVLSLTGGIRQETYDKLFANELEQDLLDRIVINQGTESYKNFPEYMSRHEWDIGIIPLRDTRFTRGKSHIKWMENSLLGVPTVASRTFPYTEPIHGVPVIINGETGLLASDDTEWEAHLELLINDPKKRRYLARDARNFVINNWQYKQHTDKWIDAFTSVIEVGSKDIA